MNELADESEVVRLPCANLRRRGRLVMMPLCRAYCSVKYSAMYMPIDRPTNRLIRHAFCRDGYVRVFALISIFLGLCGVSAALQVYSEAFVNTTSIVSGSIASGSTVSGYGTNPTMVSEGISSPDPVVFGPMPPFPMQGVPREAIAQFFGIVDMESDSMSPPTADCVVEGKTWKDVYMAHLRYVGDSNWRAVADCTMTIREYMKSSSFLNAPELSLTLIDKITRDIAKVDTRRARKYFDLALELSPDHPRVLYYLATQTGVYKFTETTSLLWEAGKSILRRPFLLMRVGWVALYVVVVAVLVALLVSCFVLLVVHLEDILLTIGDLLPFVIRGVLAPFILAMLCVVPVFYGGLILLSVWSLLICLHSQSYRPLFWTTLALFFCLPIALHAGERINSFIAVGSILEDINAGALTLYSEEILQSEKLNNFDRDILSAILSKRLVDLKENVAADRLLDSLLGNLLSREDAHPAMTGTVLLNLGANKLALHDYGKAEDVLKKAEVHGEYSFELFLNLAQVTLSNFNMEEHRRYIGLAREENWKRLEDFDQRRDSGNGWVTKSLPPIVFLDLAWKKLLEATPAVKYGSETIGSKPGMMQNTVTNVVPKTAQIPVPNQMPVGVGSGIESLVYSSLAPFSGLKAYWIFAVIYFAVGIVTFISQHKLKGLSLVMKKPQPRPHQSWLILPGTVRLLCGTVLTGLTLLSLVVAVGVTCYTGPMVRLFQISPGTGWWLIGASVLLVVYLVVIVVDYMSWNAVRGDTRRGG